MNLQYHIIGVMIVLLLLAGCTNNNSETTGNSAVDSNDDPDKVTIYFFWGDGCPHCEAEKPFLEDLQEKYPEIEVKMFETWKNPANAKLFQEVAKAYGTSAQGVPTTFVGDEYWVGYANHMGSEIEAKIYDCIQNDCINPGDKLQ